MEQSIKKVPLTDILLSLYVLWIILVSCHFNERLMSNDKFIQIGILAIIYVCVRVCGGRIKNSWIYKCIVVIGIIEAIIGLLQQKAWLEPVNHYFISTGTFSNPGPFGCFLGISLIIIVYYSVEAYKNRHFFTLTCFLCSTLLVGGMFVYSFSRAAWLAFFVVLWLLLFINYRKRFLLFMIVSLICLFLGIGYLYYLKKDSADGRLFIWRVGIELLKDKPLQGAGNGSFAARYMYAQSDYFIHHPTSSNERFACNNTFAFNEYLRIACEYGFLGLFLFGAIIVYSLWAKEVEVLNKLLLLYIYIFSFFSYPAEIFTFPLLLTVLLALNSNCIKRYRMDSCTLSILSITFSVGILIVSWGSYLNTITNKFNKDFILTHARQSYREGNYSLAKEYLLKASKLAPTSEIVTDLGNTYFYLGAYQDAEMCFIRAIYMTPSHILPRYNLFRLYVETGRRQDAVKWGEIILSRTYKKEGTVAMEVKAYVRSYLNRYPDIIK